MTLGGERCAALRGQQDSGRLLDNHRVRRRWLHWSWLLEQLRVWRWLSLVGLRVSAECTRALLSAKLFRQSASSIPALVEPLTLLFLLDCSLVLDVLFLSSFVHESIYNRAVMVLSHLLQPGVLLLLLLLYRWGFLSHVVVLVYDSVLVSDGDLWICLMEVIVLLFFAARD